MLLCRYLRHETIGLLYNLLPPQSLMRWSMVKFYRVLPNTAEGIVFYSLFCTALVLKIAAWAIFSTLFKLLLHRGADQYIKDIRPLSFVEFAYQYKLPNRLRKYFVGFLVTFPPNAATPPHWHAGAAVSEIVIEGTLLNKINSDPTRVFGKGGS